MQTVTIGNVSILPILDTPVLMNPRMFFPKHGDMFMEEFGHVADERGLFAMSITCFLLRSGGQTYLLDSGLGNRRRPGFPRGKLDESLRELGVDPGEIDVVLNTHLHVDHVGWNTVDDDDGRKRVFFPNAEFYFQRAEWDFWMTPDRLSDPANQHLVDCVEPLRDTGRIKFFEGEGVIDSALTYLPTPGHTPGHVAVGIASAGERAVIIGDASHHPSQLLHPDWSPGADIDPVLSARTREALFEMAIAEQPVWIAGHWEFPGIGRIVRIEGKRVFRAL
jgi:glyoxylase-like metal-dependent hydrolase (beta-lactamase superfamily II)